LNRHSPLDSLPKGYAIEFSTVFKQDKPEETMNERTKEVLDKTLQFGVDTIAFSQSLPHNATGWTIARQVIRSTTSVGANFREAQYARSRAEFVSRIQIALQEAAESLYWFQVVKASALGNSTQLDSLLREADQLVSILVAICNSTKRNPGGRP
jgi:four helix bundle protein